MTKMLTLTPVGFLSLILLLVVIRANPLPSTLSDRSELYIYPEGGDYFEGDIILLPQQKEYFQAKAVGEHGGRSVINDSTALWPNNTVYYKFSPKEFNITQQNAVEKALKSIMSVSCMKFVQRTTQPTYIVLRNKFRGCAAAVGYHTSGPLDMFLGGPSCQTQGTIQHEFLHTLGFWHEHTRRDRDNYVTINWDNIRPGSEGNFERRSESEITNQDLPYDYGSVMHYRNIAFSKDFKKVTITPKDPGAASKMGQRKGISIVDIAKLNRLYQCSEDYYLGEDLVRETTNKIGSTEEMVGLKRY